MHRILIVDDHPLICSGIRTLFSDLDRFEVIGEANNKQTAFHLMDSLTPTLVIMDLFSGEGDGLAFIKECRIRHQNLPLIVFTVQSEEIWAERFLRAGACGFVSKKKKPEELIQAVETVSRGELYLSQKTASRMISSALERKRRPPEDPFHLLSDRELHIFRLCGSRMSNKEIAKALGLSHRTVESHKENIKIKLQISSARELRHLAVSWVERGACPLPHLGNGL